MKGLVYPVRRGFNIIRKFSRNQPLSMAPSQHPDAIQLDGRKLEGGGQLVRVAVALSALTGRRVTIENIRGNRSGKRGLKASHLAAITTLAELSGSKLYKAQVGSCTVGFYPPPPEEREAHLSQSRTDSEINIRLPTPGSVFLVFQALYPYLLHSASTDKIRLSIIGGTNVSSSPSFDYVSQVLIPNFARVGLPPLFAHLEKRGWASSHGHSGLGKVVFAVDTLRSRDWSCRSPTDGSDSDSPGQSHEVAKPKPKIPSIDLHKCRRGAVTKIDITVLAPDDQLEGPDSTTNWRNQEHGVQQDVEPKDNAESITLREFMEQYTHKTLRKRLKELPRAVFGAPHPSGISIGEPDLEGNAQSHGRVVPIETHTTEATHRRSCLYVLIVAHTSTGFRIGRDAMFGSLSDEPRSKSKPKKSQKGQKGKKSDEDVVSKVTGIVDKCVEQFLCDLYDPEMQGADELEDAQHRPCVDENMRDQLVVFEALGRMSDQTQDGEKEDERYWSLHTKTAQWVCQQLLGDSCIR